MTVLRRTGAPFTELADGRISNFVRVKIVNRGAEARTYTLRLADPEVELEAPQNPVTIAGRGEVVSVVFLTARREAFARGERPVRLIVSDDAGFSDELDVTLLGP